MQPNKMGHRAVVALTGLALGCAPVIGEPVVPTPDTDDDVVTDTEVTNLPPLADAGRELRVPIGTPTRIRGESVDPDGDALLREWTLLDAPEGSRARLRSDGDQARLTPDLEGVYTLELRVEDPAGASDTASTTLTAVDTWGEDGGRPTPGHVYVLGPVGDACTRGLSRPGALDGPALIGLGCEAELESPTVQLDGAVWWHDTRTAYELECDGRCLVRSGDPLPEGALAANDTRLELPCEQPRDLLLGPGHLMARCPDGWRGDLGVIEGDQWVPFALHTDPIGLVRGVAGARRNAISVIDFRTGEITLAEPDLDWEFLRAWRTHEDGFRVAAFDNRGRTQLVEVGPDGAVTELATYAQVPPGASVFVGSRLDAAGNLYSVVRADGRSQVLRFSLDGGLDVVHDDADDPLVRLADGGELVSSP